MSTQTAYENEVRRYLQDPFINADGFQAWPKTPRLYRDIVVTEKIDGTNACVVVSDDGSVVFAQSRKKVILPSQDNFGFARWVFENRAMLADKLGPGRHYGEWYGSGIQTGYGLKNGEKYFMLFNANRWTEENLAECGLDAINVEAPTIMYQGPFDTAEVNNCVDWLRGGGSVHRPYDGKAEGVIVYHVAAGRVFKVTCVNDEKPKGSKEQS